MNDLTTDLNEIRNRISSSNTIWNTDDDDLKREEIGNIVSEVTGFDFTDGDTYQNIVDKLCTEYLDSNEDETDDGYTIDSEDEDFLTIAEKYSELGIDTIEEIEDSEEVLEDLKIWINEKLDVSEDEDMLVEELTPIWNEKLLQKINELN